MHDVAIIGGSYAGMAAALQLLRARKRVLVIDAGNRRNRMADHAHGYLTQDGVDPAEIARIAREQLQAYRTLDWRNATAERAAGSTDDFAVATSDGETHAARRLLFAIGVSDALPEIEGMEERWGKHVFHCPYCHGYELNQGRIGVIATSSMSQHQAALLTEWGDTTFFVNGAYEMSAEDRAHLVARGVTIESKPIVRLEGEADVRLNDGRVMNFAGLFTASRNAPSTAIAERLGCELEETPFGMQIRTDGGKATSVPGVFACGDVARAPHSLSLAVGDGAWAGANIHRSLVF
jgi:thioredoxin reductase